MTVTSMLANATSDTTAAFAVSVTSGSVRVIYTTTEPAPADPIAVPLYSVAVAVDAQGAAKVAVTGLAANTRYWWRVEDNGVEDLARTGTILTPPPAGVAASFVFGASGDAGQTPVAPGFTNTEQQPERISNYEIHRYLGERAIARNWVAHFDDGDRTYYDLGNTGAGFPDSTLANYRQMYGDLQLQPNQRVLYDSVSDIYTWDDHDYGPNDSDGTFAGKANAAQVYRERIPHHDLPDPDGAIYRSFQWGRCLFVLWDCRFHRSPIADPEGPAKTMLGAAQKAWFQNLIETTTAEVIFIMSSVQWMSGGAGGWAGYTTERDEIADMITAAGKANRVVMFSADAHVLAIDSGGNNAWGSWPCAIFAPRDATTGVLDATYDILAPTSARGQYGEVSVTDLGSVITVRLAAWQFGTEVASYTKAFPVTAAAPPVSIADLITGSHTVVYEATVCAEYQSGPAPDGIPIEVTGGDVTFDATADTWSSFTLETPGVDEDAKSLYPRFPSSLLAPLGNEVFLRTGIDTGAGGIVWESLGYFRIDDVDQDDAPDAPIRLAGPDRWAKIAESTLLFPRQYTANQTLAAVVYDLVLDLYPNAIVVWDDDDEQLPLGRDLLVEENRAAALREIARARGKIVYFDGDGILRFEAAPDPTEPVWHLRAGQNGVLTAASRSASRQDVYNGVVATGEGAGDVQAIGIMIDVGPDSPTRWGGRFGMKPYKFSSSLLTDNASARAAAATVLRRVAGLPQDVTFGTITNPTLRPRLGVRITEKDGHRSLHVVQSLTIPLSTASTMQGTTREQTLVHVGSLLPAEVTNGNTEA